MENTCSVCGKKYQAKRASSLFCSGACRIKSYRQSDVTLKDDVTITPQERDDSRHFSAPSQNTEMDTVTLTKKLTQTLLGIGHNPLNKDQKEAIKLLNDEGKQKLAESLATRDYIKSGYYGGKAQVTNRVVTSIRHYDHKGRVNYYLAKFNAN